MIPIATDPGHGSEAPLHLEPGATTGGDQGLAVTGETDANITDTHQSTRSTDLAPAVIPNTVIARSIVTNTAANIVDDRTVEAVIAVAVATVRGTTLGAERLRLLPSAPSHRFPGSSTSGCLAAEVSYGTRTSSGSRRGYNAPLVRRMGWYGCDHPSMITAVEMLRPPSL